MSRADPTTWAYKDGKRAALAGEPRDSNPCDPNTEAARSYQWLAGYDASVQQPANPQTPPGELLAFVTSDPAVVGCTAQAVAAAAVMRLANCQPEEHWAGDWLFNNSESVASAVLSGLGIDGRSKGRLAHAKEQAAGVDREAIALALVNENRRFAGLNLYTPDAFAKEQEHRRRDWLRYADAILALAKAAPASSVGEGDLRHKLRMVVSHATGGHLDLQDAPNLSVNDICVQISQHHNRVWEGGMEKGRASTLSTPDRAPAPADLVEADRDAVLVAYRHLKKVGDRLSVCAQTTGGVAGPDAGLQEAIAEWGKCGRLLSDMRNAAAEPDCPISAGAAALAALRSPDAIDGGDHV